MNDGWAHGLAERDYRLPGDLEGTVPITFSLRAAKPGTR